MFADLGGIAPGRLSDAQALSALTLAAANAAGLHAVAPPIAQSGPNGVVIVLACHGGHVAIHALPETGICFADVVAVGKTQPQRGLDVIIRRLDARDVHTDARHRTPAPAASTSHSERR
ncbi:MAG TPA: S-adenosylmethionine decarboxylase [Gemmatimonadales bacterium]|nr:S-adenosylmethionine decarboxylase [Gemmatimonadales bacterium]